MRRVLSAEAAESLYGPNPLRERGMFPRHWGDAPAGFAALGEWMKLNAVQDGVRKGDPVTASFVLEMRREDPAAVRERAQTAVRNRLRREWLDLFRDCP